MVDICQLAIYVHWGKKMLSDNKQFSESELQVTIEQNRIEPLFFQQFVQYIRNNPAVTTSKEQAMQQQHCHPATAQ